MGCAASTKAESGQVQENAIKAVEPKKAEPDTLSARRPQLLSISVDHVDRTDQLQQSPAESKDAIAFQQHKDEPVNGRYMIGRKLGRGKFGVVYAAKDLVTKRQVAVKEISALDPSFRRHDALKEIEIMKALDHPRCVKLLDAWEGKTDFYMVQELAEGGELFDYIVSKGRLLEQEAADIARQILEGVAYMHSNGVCHRDLKPQNLLISSTTPSATIKIADFGLSALLTVKHDDDAMLTICGSPDFLAPEVVSLSLHSSPQSGYSSKVDVWAVGAILYTMLCGTPPFANANVVATLMEIREGKVKYEGQVWETISKEARDFTSWLMQAEPQARPSSAEGLRHAWLGESTLHPQSALQVAALSRYCLCLRACQVKRLASCIRIMTPKHSGALSSPAVTCSLSPLVRAIGERAVECSEQREQGAV